MKEQIREIFLRLGADICGIANIDRFSNAPQGFHPKDIYADCKSVIVFAMAIPKGLGRVNPRIIYKHFNHITPVELDRIGYMAAQEIERSHGAIAVPVPSDDPYEYWDANKLEGRGLLSLKHASVQAGIGTLGKSTLLLNKQYGTRLNIGAVLLDLDLPSDPLTDDICIEGCSLCLDSCPAQALDGQTANQKLCRQQAYGVNTRGYDVVNCNTCRVVCPKADGEI